MRWLIVLLMPLLACGPEPRPRQGQVVATSSVDNGVVALVVSQDGTFPFTRLHISLTNLSGAPLALHTHSLPWASPYALRLNVTAGDGRPLRLFYPIADLFGGDTLSLPPGATVSGTYDLLWQVDDIEATLAREPVRVDWVYPSALPGVIEPTGIGPPLRGTIILQPAALDPGAA